MKISSSIFMVISAILCARSKTPENIIYAAIAFQFVMTTGDLMCGFIHNMGYLEKTMISIKRCLKLLEIP